MLINFTFSNYGSYSDTKEQTLSMEATRATEMSETLINVSNRKLLPVVALYGPNGGGKSNLLSALDDCIRFIATSNSVTEDGKDYFDTFAFTENKTSKFKLNFKCEKNFYEYIFHVAEEKILFEKISIVKKTTIEELYIREENNFKYFSDKFSSLKKYSNDVNDDVLFLSVILKLKNRYIEEIRNWIENFEHMDFGEIFFEMYNEMKNRYMTDSIEEDKKIYLNIFKNSDMKVDDIQIEEVKVKNSKGKDSIHHQVYFIYDGIKIPLQKESAGTQKLFSLIPNLYLNIKNGGVLAIDEIDAKLHPSLASILIKMYTDREINVKNAQLLFTSHNVCYLQKKLLRRDEIYFVTKESDRASKIERLYDIRDKDGNRVRNDSDYLKNYMDNVFGYIPEIDKLF